MTTDVIESVALADLVRAIKHLRMKGIDTTPLEDFLDGHDCPLEDINAMIDTGKIEAREVVERTEKVKKKKKKKKKKKVTG